MIMFVWKFFSANILHSLHLVECLFVARVFTFSDSGSSKKFPVTKRCSVTTLQSTSGPSAIEMAHIRAQPLIPILPHWKRYFNISTSQPFMTVWFGMTSLKMQSTITNRGRFREFWKREMLGILWIYFVAKIQTT